MTAVLEAPRASSWPLERRDAAVLGAWFVGLVAVWWAIGELLIGPFGDSALVRADERIARSFADGRTPRVDDLSIAGGMLADTFVKIGVTAVAVAIVLALWRSWRDALMIALPLILEASSFIVVTWLVGRPRPDVPRLEESPVASSFPSGHTAAAVAYAAIAVVIWWRVENRLVRAVTVVLVVAVPVIVGWARTYGGMHHLTDVVAGALLGACSVFAVWLVLHDRSPEPGLRPTERS